MSPKSAPFDELDRKIVTALMVNARTSFAVIGAEVGLSATAVKRRVDRMRETGVVTGFTATVKPAALGWRTEAYVEVYCEGAAPPRRLAEVVRNHPEITAAMTVTGARTRCCMYEPGTWTTSRRCSSESVRSRSSARRSVTWCCRICSRRARRRARTRPAPAPEE